MKQHWGLDQYAGRIGSFLSNKIRNILDETQIQFYDFSQKKH
jgi:hypothetical protein